MEDGKWFETKEGTPQGAVISPLLANLYLHYVLDLWVEAWRKKVAHGDVIVVRYADDAVPGFQHRAEAERFLADLRERLRKFGLELHPEKTRLIEFGRYAAERRAKRGEGKPETFNFLGFTHICGKNHATGYFMVLRRTIGKRMAAKLKDMRQQLRRRMHARTSDTVKWLRSVVRGYFQYHAIPRNEDRMKAFRNEVLRMWMWALRRRSQRTRWTWDKFLEKLGNLLPEVEVLHPYPDVRFASDHPNFGGHTQGKNRVRQERQHGSVRGAVSNDRPYRDPWPRPRSGAVLLQTTLMIGIRQRGASAKRNRRATCTPFCGRAGSPTHSDHKTR